MKTRIYNAEDLNHKIVQEDIKKTLLHGGHVIFPTETVYGIGAYAFSEKGISNIYKVKGRPNDNPLIMHVNTYEDVMMYSKNHMAYVKKLMDAFMPGPLTLVLEKQNDIPDMITGGLDTVGIRMPNHPIAKKIIEIAGVPICAPSANISGRPSSTRFNHVLEDFDGKVDIMIDGGKSEVGLESTVLDVTHTSPVILRPGMITKEMLLGVVDHVLVSDAIIESDIPKAPGMKYKHYAPKGQLVIVKGPKEKVIAYINQKLKDDKQNGFISGVICTKDAIDKFPLGFVISIGDQDDEKEIAANLFSTLREMDQKQIDMIYSFSFDQGSYKEAIMNRLLKAANHHMINLDQ